MVNCNRESTLISIKQSVKIQSKENDIIQQTGRIQ